MSEPYKVGDGVEMRVKNGAVTLYSNGGMLWPDWFERASIDRWKVKSIHVAKGTIKLPEDVQGIDTQKKVFTMFGGLSKVKSIDMSSFDTSCVTNMSCMFSSCHELTTLNLSSFDTAQVTCMSGMFASCESIKELDLSGFDMSNVTDMNSMFWRCRNLKELDLSGFNTSRILDMRSLFEGCCNLKTVIMAPAVNQDARTDKMFDDCRAEIIQSSR